MEENNNIIGIWIEDSDKFMVLKLNKDFQHIFEKINEYYNYKYYHIFSDIFSYDQFIKEHKNEFRHGFKDYGIIKTTNELKLHIQDFHEDDLSDELLDYINNLK